MPIPGENVEVLFSGLDQKTSSVLTAPGKLERAENIEFDKAGELNKRAGYQAISNTATDGLATNAVRHRLVLAHGELVVLTGTLGFACGDVAETLQSGTRALVRRSVASGGGLSFEDIVTGPDRAEDG